MPWIYNNQIFEIVPKEMEGFVYLITNLTTQKKYIGKKTFWERRKDLKTGRRKKRESNWKKYFGSCQELIEDVKNLGEDQFHREILYLCPHKKSMSYFETYEQFTRNVLFNENYYNYNIEGKFFSSEQDNIYSKVIKSEVLH